MSIATETTRIQNAKSALKTAINAKNDAQHQIDDERIDDYATFVGDIQLGTDVSDTTAVAGDVLSGKDFYLADGTKTTGTIQTYSGTTTRTSNGTFSTAGKYVSSNLTVNVNPSEYIYRHLNPTIIKIGNAVSPVGGQTITIKVKQLSTGVVCKMNWGDGTIETISNSTSTQTFTHTYAATAVIANIVFSPDTQGNNRFALNSNAESRELLSFDAYMFGQSSSASFQLPVSIYCGDCTWFKANSLSYCSNIEVLDFTNMNSLMEQTMSGSTGYFTQNYLESSMCQGSAIWHLVIGSGINEIKSGCFASCGIWNVTIIEARGIGKSTTPITLDSTAFNGSTIYNKIFINHLRFNTYQTATNWSSYSSLMTAY